MVPVVQFCLCDFQDWEKTEKELRQEVEETRGKQEEDTVRLQEFDVSHATCFQHKLHDSTHILNLPMVHGNLYKFQCRSEFQIQC